MTQQSQFAIETGVQLYARVSSMNRPSVIHLDDNIFGETPLEPKQTIEITGESNSGKTFLLTNIIAKALIQGNRIILIETDNTMSFPTLITLLETEIEREDSMDENSSDKQMEIIENCLKNLIILRCYNDFEMEVVLSSKLEEILLAEKDISIIAVDSISAFYWSEFNSEEPMRMETYFTNTLRRFRRICDDYKLVLGYTRPSSFISGQKSQDDKLIDYRIELRVADDKNDDCGNDEIDDDDCENVFEAKISFNDKMEVKSFTISPIGINWI